MPTLREHEALDDARLPPEFRRAGPSLELAELELKEQIGSGAFSKVYRGMYKGQEVAVKTMPVDKDAAKYLESELAILKCVALIASWRL